MFCKHSWVNFYYTPCCMPSCDICDLDKLLSLHLFARHLANNSWNHGSLGFTYPILAQFENPSVSGEGPNHEFYISCGAISVAPGSDRLCAWHLFLFVWCRPTKSWLMSPVVSQVFIISCLILKFQFQMHMIINRHHPRPPFISNLTSKYLYTQYGV